MRRQGAEWNHAFIKRRMREGNAVFGGEAQDTIPRQFHADNGFIPALMILDLMSKRASHCTSC
jgi:phosphomannomutase